MSFKAMCQAIVGWDWLSGGRDNSHLAYEKNFAEGTDDNQADCDWHLEGQTLANGVTVDYDLTALARTVLGDTLTIELGRLRLLQIVVTSTTGGTLRVGNCPTDPWWEPFGEIDDTVEVPPDSTLLLSNRVEGWDVLGVADSSSSSSGETAAGRNLRLEAIGGDVTYSIAIVGILRSTLQVSSSSGS